MLDNIYQNYRESVNLHRLDVSVIAAIVATAIQIRSREHDISKMEGEELKLFSSASLIFGPGESEDLTIHLKNNRHHPEHFYNGISGMTLVDIVEMFCDWFAKSSRSSGDFIDEINTRSYKYDIPKELVSIFQNTAKELEGIDAEFLNLHGNQIAKSEPKEEIKPKSVDLAPQFDQTLSALSESIKNLQKFLPEKSRE